MSVKALLDIVRFGPSGRIRWLRQSREDNCVQTVLAIVLGLSCEVVEAEVGTTGALTIHDTLDLLSDLGVPCRPIAAELAADFWPVFYRRAGKRKLRGIGIQLPRRGEPIGHAYVLSGKTMYDPATGRKYPMEPDVIRERLNWLAIFPDHAHRAAGVEALRRRQRTAA